VQKSYWHPRAAYFNAMLVDIHGVHKESVPGSGPEGMQLLRLAGFHDFGAPSIPFDVLVPRPREATGLLVSSAGAYTHQAYAAFPRMETGRIAQGHTCAVAAYHALRGSVPVHETDVRRVQITNLRLNGQSLVYFDDIIPGTYWHLVDQMLGCRRVPERNDQGVFQREDRMTAVETRTYLERLFRDYTEHPAPEERLKESLAALGDDAEAAITRAQVVHALSAVADFTLPKEEPAKPFADVEPDSLLARQLAAWAGRGWIAPDVRHAFRPDDPVPFSEFKRHAYHVLFAGIAPETVRPVNYRPRLAHDTFNRADGPLERLASGQPVAGTGAWAIVAGNLRPSGVDGTTYLLVDAGQSDVDVSVDVFLEQTANQAAAGLVLRADDERNMQRFLVEAEGPGVKVRINTLVEGQFADEISLVRRTHRRGFTLRLVARGEELTYFLDGRQVHRQKRERFLNATRVGLLNGGGEASRFDNLEVRAAD
ncbi:MAG: hypothetical protein ABIP48_16900, partial [Planctomycetota bacterium]